MGVETYITLYPKNLMFLPKIENLINFLGSLENKKFIEQYSREFTFSYYGYNELIMRIPLTNSIMKKIIKILKSGKDKDFSYISLEKNDNLKKELTYITLRFTTVPQKRFVLDHLVSGHSEAKSGNIYSNFSIEWGGKCSSWISEFVGPYNKLLDFIKKELLPLFENSFKVKGRIGFYTSV